MLSQGGRGNDFGVAALVHGPGDESVFRHGFDAEFAAAAGQRHDLLIGVERMRPQETREVFVAANHDVFDGFGVEERVFRDASDDLRVGRERNPGRRNGFHARQGEGADAMFRVAIAFRVPDPV